MQKKVITTGSKRSFRNCLSMVSGIFVLTDCVIIIVFGNKKNLGKFSEMPKSVKRHNIKEITPLEKDIPQKRMRLFLKYRLGTGK